MVIKAIRRNKVLAEVKMDLWMFTRILSKDLYIYTRITPSYTCGFRIFY